jgi:hypothetical protein
MRSLIVVTIFIFCLASTPAFACSFDTECKTGTMCVDGACTRDLNSDNDQENVPVKRATKGKTCDYDADCDPGSRCIKGSGVEGVCLGH